MSVFQQSLLASHTICIFKQTKSVGVRALIILPFLNINAHNLSEAQPLFLCEDSHLFPSLMAAATAHYFAAQAPGH